MTSDLPQALWIGGAPWTGKSTVARLLATRHGLTTYHHDDRTSPDDVPAGDELAAVLRQRFERALADLRALDSPRPIVAEGWGLRPELVAPLVDSPSRMVVLVPTELFRQHQLRHRPDEPAIPRQRTRLTRDRMLAAQAVRSARELGIRVIEIDGRLDPAGVTDVVAEHFHVYLDA
ncbi:ATP-binding protein [Amycolatopsis sp. OK19-0408]|uniref:ATP-binding protein n=1 Tax=Amycolatopsis iheyensis TaxID=2945988 RepID=A0A9X2SNP7_9PSEU|nr:ATP-binding protein [Amycolatopsis iheyensis]MCR6489262.1 ATP-binding protein [Amycolatopsis iheyensis]